jgi:multidrug efflux pump subunit AcrA (membrane-fusion protein)
MSRLPTSSPPPSRTATAKTTAFRRLLFAVPVVAAVPVIAWLGLPRPPRSSEEDAPAMHTVERGRFVYDLAGGGNVESTKPVEICCEVPSYGGGATILWIAPEGTHVEPAPDWKPEEPGEEPPDLLVKLDSSALEERLLEQQISCNTYEAALVEAQNVYQTALLAKEQYVEGTFLQDKLTKESKIFVAQEELRKAEDTLAFNREQLAMGYVTELQVQADEFRVEKAKKDLLEAETDLEVLENFTQKKMLNTLESSIAVAESRLQWREHTHRLAQEKLADLQDYLEKCTIRAPQAGQVVYANVTDHHGHQHVIIEEGTIVRQHQPIIKMPGAGNMQVKARINEARVSLVDVGMPAVVELDAFSEVRLAGTVEKVGEYPMPSSWRAGYLREYEVIVKIDSYPEEFELRPGMSAKIFIRVEQLDDVLILPVEALFEHRGRHYCVLSGDDGLEARQLVIGSANDEEVVVQEGLSEGEQVALAAADYRDKLDLP